MSNRLGIPRRNRLEMLGEPDARWDFMRDTVDPRFPIQYTGGNGYSFNADGNYALATTNQMRTWYDPVTKARQGARFEAAATNLLATGTARDWTQASWVKVTMTNAFTSTGITGVATSCTRLTAAGANSTILQTVVSASATRYWSVWIRRITGSGNIDLCTDGVTFSTVTVTSAWSRVFVTQAAVTNPICGIRIVTSGDAIDVDFGQLESTRLTSACLPGAARLIDLAKIDVAGIFNGLFNQLEGMMYCRWVARDVILSTTRPAFTLDDTGANEFFIIFSDGGGGQIKYSITDGGVAQAAILTTVPVEGTRYAVSAQYKLNDIQASINGTANVTDTAATIPTPTQFVFGGRTTAGGLGGDLQECMYWKRAYPQVLRRLSELRP